MMNVRDVAGDSLKAELFYNAEDFCFIDRANGTSRFRMKVRSVKIAERA